MLATSGRTLEISNTVGHQCFANLRQRKNGQTHSSIGVDYSIAFCALLLGERVHVDRVVVVNRQHRHRGEQMSSANESLSTSIPASSRPDRSLCWHHVYWTRLEHKRRRWRRRFVSIDNSLFDLLRHNKIEEFVAVQKNCFYSQIRPMSLRRWLRPLRRLLCGCGGRVRQWCKG